MGNFVSNCILFFIVYLIGYYFGYKHGWDNLWWSGISWRKAYEKQEENQI